MAVALIFAGCSKTSGPSSASSGASSSILTDEEAVKAVKAWIQTHPMMATPAADILE